MSLRSDGYVPKMVKSDTGETVEVCEGLAEARGKLGEALVTMNDAYITSGDGSFWGPLMGKIYAADALLAVTSAVEIPSIVEAGFTTKPKKNWWREIIE